MNTARSLMRGSQKALAIVLLIPILAGFTGTRPTQAATLNELQQQQAQLKQKAADDRQAAEAQKSVAERAADRLAEVGDQIYHLENSISTTQDQITDTENKIAAKDQEGAKLESDLRGIHDQQDAMVRQLYIQSVSQPDILSLFSDQSLSKREETSQEFQALQKAAAAVVVKTQEQQKAVSKARADLDQNKQTLLAYQDQQTQQQHSLADVQQQQANLKSNAESTELALEADAAKAQAQAAQIQQKINLLASTSSWGSQIISSDDPSWYYSQTGDYTRLGGGPYTVSEVGCYITSIAMVSTYYGNHVTPDYIANNGVFYDGYLVSLPPVGITLHPYGSVNWGVVANEVQNGRPVIVSIYLPSVGAVNSDGSSHFIVIKGLANGKYIMHDPIGSGRSYNLNQVRSMILVTR
jgi:hypothetical protein